MLKSMTGYGKAEQSAGTKKITVEVRSLNSKQLDLSVKMPQHYRSYESQLRSMASRVLCRGKADIFVNVECTSQSNAVTINAAAFTDYFNQLHGIATGLGVQWGTPDLNASMMRAVLRLPEIVNTDMESVTQEEVNALLQATGNALEAIESFRNQEGAVLREEILGRINTISSLLEQVEPHEKGRAEVIRNRIREAILNCGLSADENRLEQEMVYYIEKLDITEEKVRLKNHCDYFIQVATGENNPGRKLVFISQEIGREINTLGSKANDANIQRIVVEMKDELEKAKEQLLNVL